jgi:hypothetical protein
LKIDDLLSRLASMFPNATGYLSGWARVYRENLPEGPRLQTAFDRCMAEWTRSSPPKPAEIAKHVPADKPASERNQGAPAYDLHNKREDRCWAEKVMRGKPGAAACERGFARELLIWAERNPGRWPDDRMLAHLEQEQRNHERRARQMNAGEDASIFARKLRSLADAMEDANERLVRHYAQYHENP